MFRQPAVGDVIAVSIRPLGDDVIIALTLRQGATLAVAGADVDSEGDPFDDWEPVLDFLLWCRLDIDLVYESLRRFDPAYEAAARSELARVMARTGSLGALDYPPPSTASMA